MADEEVYRRLNLLEKEIYSMNRQLTEITSEKPMQRLTLLEEAVRQVKHDVISIEQISSDMYKKMEQGLDELNKQAIQTRGRISGFLGAMTVLLMIVNLWPLIREALKAAVS